MKYTVSSVLMAVGLVLGVTVWAAGEQQGQVSGGSGMMGRRPPNARSAGTGASTYADHCSTCHGATGKGDGPAAAALFPKPKDLANCKKMASISDETLFKAIRGGGRSVGLSPIMPSWGESLTDQQIHDLVGYIRSLCKK